MTNTGWDGENRTEEAKNEDGNVADEGREKNFKGGVSAAAGVENFFLYIIKLLMDPILKCPEISPEHYLDFFQKIDFLGSSKLQFKYKI